MAHTPGPWIVGDKPGVWVGPVITANSGKKGIAFVVGQTDSGWLGGYETSVGKDRTNANARLIAAAPELLAACREMLASDGLIGNQPSVFRAVQSMRAAINKAEGRSI